MTDKPPMNWFSNFIPFKAPLSDGLLVYPTPEHYYQAQKSMSHFERARIAKLDTPGQAKRSGKKMQMRPDWERVKWIVMMRAQLWRVETDLEFAEKLLTNDLVIIERNTWHDNYWGICICDKCPKSGKNMLGKILMNIRSCIMESSN